MLRKMSWLTVFAFSIVWCCHITFGQDSTKQNIAGKKLKNPYSSTEFEILFHDGTNVRLTILTQDFQLLTNEGEKTIPFLEVNRIEFKEKVSDVVENYDAVHKGKIVLDNQLKVLTKQFGETTMKTDQIKVIQRYFSGQKLIDISAEKFATKTFDKWLDSEIDLSDRGPLRLDVTGKLDHYSKKPGTVLFSANGSDGSVQTPFLVNISFCTMFENQILQGFPGGGIGGNGIGGRNGFGGNGIGGAGIRGNPQVGFGGNGFPGNGIGGGFGQPQVYNQTQTIPTGSLIAKIGENGVPFLVGESIHMKKVLNHGRLYFLIAQSQWDIVHQGKFEIKIDTVP